MKRMQDETLGAMQAEYSRNPKIVKTNRVLSIVFIGLGLIGLLWGLVLAVSDFESGNYIICLGGGLAPLFLGLWAFWQWRREKDDRVTLYEQGLVFQDRKGIQALAWSDVTAVRMSMMYFPEFQKTHHTYVLEKADGTKLTIAFDNRAVAGIEALGDTLQQEVSRCVTPQLRQRFKRGESLPFGPFTVSQSHLKYKKELLTWDDVDRVLINNGKMLIYPRQGRKSWVDGTLAKVPLIEVPNLLTFISILNDVIGVQQNSLVEHVRRRRR